MTQTYRCDQRMRPVKDGDEFDNGRIVEGPKDAAWIFANRLAKKIYGRRGYCHHVRRDVVNNGGRYANYEAFIGVPWERGGCSGQNVWLTVYADPPLRPASVGAWE